MAISKKRLALMIAANEIQQHRLSPTFFHQAVQKFYCPQMVTRGLCTRECELCRPALEGALSRIDDSARNPEALLTWRLRGAVAIQAEKKAEAEKQPIITRDELGLEIKGTGFGALEAMFGAQG